MQVLEHVGLLDVYLEDPEFLFTFEHELNGLLGVFGCHLFNEHEVFEFVRFRAARLCGVGRFDSELEYVHATVAHGTEQYKMSYNIKEWKYEWTE